MKRLRVKTVVWACVVAGIGLWALYPLEPEPRYRGTRLSTWLALYSENRECAEAESAEGKKAAKAAKAIRHIGTNGLPFMLKWMRDGPSRSLYFDVDGWFEILGPEAAPAIPALTQMLNSAEQGRVRQAIYPLAYIGKDGLPVLVAALDNPKNPDRSTIVDAIRLMAINGIDTSLAVPVFVKCLGDKDTWLAMWTADALSWVARKDPNAVIPALTACLGDPRKEVRDEAAGTLGSFRGKARAALPELQNLLTDVDPHVRWQASNSLGKIAPELIQGKAQAETRTEKK